MRLVDEVWSGIGGDASAAQQLAPLPSPAGALPSSFDVEGLGAAACAAVGLALAELTGAAPGAVRLDGSTIADAMRSEQALRIGDELPESVWDPLSRIYRAADGWVRLHGNYAQHRAAIQRSFGTTDPEKVAEAIASRPADDTEAALHAAGGVAAVARSLAAWAEHPHGALVETLPLVQTTFRVDRAPAPWQPEPGRPLAGLRVLELTRVIAGPVAARTLSWFGADVLRVESPAHDELRTLIVDMGPGKRSVELDLKSDGGLRAFEGLLGGADVLIHGLRPSALDGLGLNGAARPALAPGLIDVSLSAYGPAGPWSERRGFDSLTQLSTGLGLAEAEAAGSAGDGPRALPCQILDHATGLILAAATIRALGARADDGHGRTIIGSLARTAALLAGAGRQPFDGTKPAAAEVGSLELSGPYGTTHHAPLPIAVDGVDGGWLEGPPLPGGDAPRWLAD